MPIPDQLAHVDAWVFDLDNTLYPHESALFPEIDRRIRAFVGNALGIDAAEAHRVQKHYFRTYATTLRGMVENHGTDPRAFLDFVHDIDLSRIQPDPEMRRALARLPGKKIVFTNADAKYADRVLHRLGLAGAFDAVFDIEAAAWLPKPNPATYARMVAETGIDPGRAVFVEDLPRNLAPAAMLGMVTVWVRNDAEWAASDPGDAAADHVIDSLRQWLCGLAAEVAPG
ncbi:MAG: pyrimidine 5'-nucleotidase [Proteobacteria bacterium]|nr:pyrimidine 5'-nucleotidase [Pseudomonadota bacterium]